MGDETLSKIIQEFLHKTQDELHLSRSDVGKPVGEVHLQSVTVRKILLVSSLYDSYIFEETGGLSDALYSEYSALKLIKPPPHISRVSTLREAQEQIKASYSSDSKSIDLVICFLRRTTGSDVWQFFQTLRKTAPRVPVLLLASNTRELSSLDPRVDDALRLNIHKTSGWEQGVNNIWAWPFLWQGDFSLIFAMIKSVEDRVNLSKDISQGDVRVILVVEDNVQFYSSYLPMLYQLVFKLTADVMRDAPNTRARVENRLKRPKILLANSYEEAIEIYEQLKSNILGIITDVGFHKNDKHDELAGIELAKVVKATTPHLPVLVQSSEKANEEQALQLGASFLLKSDPHLLGALRDFMETSIGFGPFQFRGKDGKLVQEAPTLVEFAQALTTVSDEIIEFHFDKSHFRSWFSAHNRFDIADAVAQLEISDLPLSEKKQRLLNILSEYRRKSRAALVSEFDPDWFSYDVASSGSMQKLGSGSLGGKGHGLAFLNSVVETYHIDKLFPQLSVYVPPSLILATGIFDNFVEDNDLSAVALSGSLSDEDLIRAFTSGKLKEDVENSLRIYLTKVNYPISVRSSSVFEDAMDKPYAGIYDTFMLPNNDPDLQVRLNDLTRAIKMVYASTYKKSAQAYERSSGSRPEEAKMAVVIQQLVGHRHQNDQFFPTFAGVAGSYDVYAKTDIDPNHGYCTAALGLGGTVVNGGYLARFSPANPKGVSLATQEKYLSLDLKSKAIQATNEHDLTEETSTLTIPIIDIPSENKNSGSGNLLVNVHGIPVNYVRPPTGQPNGTENVAPKVILAKLSLDEIIKNEVIPLSRILSLLLKVGSKAMSCPVEMEFAVDFEPQYEGGVNTVKIKFALLQMRAMASALKNYVPTLSMNEAPAAGTTLCYSMQALGHCLNPDIKDVVYVSRLGFDVTKTKEIADQIGKITQSLHQAKRPYILIGPGRWGTASHNLGIPVSWQQICGAGCIVETPLGTGAGVPSQGTHFFQNITSFDIPYFTVTDAVEGSVDYEWLEKYDSSRVETVGCVKHLSLDKPLQVVVDGISRCGVVMLPDISYQVFVGQANAFLDMANLPCA